MEKQIKTHQEIMDAAYTKWQQHKDWSYGDFLDNLSSIERKAVILGNFNYQVCNGGFGQWDWNDYSKFVADLLRIVASMGTELSKKVHALICSFERIKDDLEDDDEGNYDELDDKYYAIDEKFMEDVEKYLTKCQEEEN